MMLRSPEVTLQKIVLKIFLQRMSQDACNGNQFNDAMLQQPKTETSYQKMYDNARKKFESRNLPKDISVQSVFACNELHLDEVEVYGFDYDYTLAHYKPSLHDLIYNLGRENLISNLRYPTAILDMKFQPHFAIRGLNYDIEKGLLMKLDSFLQIQTDSVYRGLKKIPEEEVLKIYENYKLPIEYVEGKMRTAQPMQAKMVQIADSFAVPEMCLLCNVAEYFESNNIAYNPEILFHDIKRSIQLSHPKMHQTVRANIDCYIEENPLLPKYFEKLQSAGKKLFLVTNSPFLFVNEGMTFLAGKDWRNYFDVIIVQARKPKFFSSASRPIRIFDVESNTHLWDNVSKLEKGKIYYEGTVKQLQDLTGWRGHNVLYFGDHPYSDLADVTLAQGWRTGAIIHEIIHEIEILNRLDYKHNLHWMQKLTQLIEIVQGIEGDTAQKYVNEWTDERDQLLQKMKTVFNKQFGSVFRAYYTHSYFSRRLFRYADIYTSAITNLYDFSTSHAFYPRRGAMPHEYLYEYI